MISNDIHTYTAREKERERRSVPSIWRQQQQRKTYIEWNKIWRPRYILAVWYYTRFRVYAYFSVSSPSLDEPTTTTTTKTNKWKKKMFQTFDFQFFSRFWYCHSIVSINPKKSKKNTKELLKYRRKSSNEKLYIRCVTSAFFSLLHVCARDWFKRGFSYYFFASAKRK